MQILEITPHFFRAFNDCQTISFSPELTLFYGGNGTGKSSLAEALEWLFYGYTTRRRKGDSYSKSEYKDSYVNKRCPNGVAPYVEARLRFEDGTEHILRRTISVDNSGHLDDTESSLNFDGNNIESFADVGIYFSEAHRPIVVQHGIQDFIHTRPIDRYRAISEALGLTELVEFKDALEKAKKQYQNNPSDNLRAASKKVSMLVSLLPELGLKSLAIRWGKKRYDIQNDYIEIAEAARQITGDDSSEFSAILINLRGKQIEAIARIFNLVPHRPSSSYIQDLNDLEDAIRNFHQAVASLIQTGVEFTNSTASHFAHTHLSFWQTGLTLIDGDRPNICPFCEQPTLSHEVIETKRQRIALNEALTRTRSTYLSECASCGASARNLLQALQPLLIEPILPEAQEILRKAFETGFDDLEKFIVSNLHVTDLLQAFKEEVQSAKKFLDTASKKADNIQEVMNLSEYLEKVPDKLSKLLDTIKDAFPKYLENFIHFEPILKRELSDEQVVKQYTSFIDLFEGLPQIKLIALAKAFDDNILECQRKADQYILDKQKAVLTIREKEMIEWYGHLSPNADVQFSGLIPGRNEFRLRAKAFGKELEAAACLSQAQLNCLGLSIYIPSVLDSNSPFNFILFDDPVQAMDDEHHESFLATVTPILLDTHKVQVVVLTHVEHTAKRLRSLNVSRDHCFYRFDKMQSSGPQLKKDESINGLFSQIQNLAKGDESERTIAVDRIRVLCELIMREAIIKHTGTEAKPQASASDLMKDFRNIPAVSSKQADGLQDTIRWSDPSHHTDQIWSVPKEVQITPHIERLKTLKKELELG